MMKDEVSTDWENTPNAQQIMECVRAEVNRSCKSGIRSSTLPLPLDATVALLSDAELAYNIATLGIISGNETGLAIDFYCACEHFGLKVADEEGEEEHAKAARPDSPCDAEVEIAVEQKSDSKSYARLQAQALADHGDEYARLAEEALIAGGAILDDSEDESGSVDDDDDDVACRRPASRGTHDVIATGATVTVDFNADAVVVAKAGLAERGGEGGCATLPADALVGDAASSATESRGWLHGGMLRAMEASLSAAADIASAVATASTRVVSSGRAKASSVGRLEATVGGQ